MQRTSLIGFGGKVFRTLAFLPQIYFHSFIFMYSFSYFCFVFKLLYFEWTHVQSFGLKCR